MAENDIPLMILGIMAHHTTTVWYRFKLPFETVVLPFETVVLLFQNGTTSCLKQDWSGFETGVLPVNTGSSGFWYRSASSLYSSLGRVNCKDEGAAKPRV